jgi:hypothetical protein
MSCSGHASSSDSHVVWDCRAVDVEHLDALDQTSAELVWGFSEQDMEQPRFHLFREKARRLVRRARLLLNWLRARPRR